MKSNVEDPLRVTGAWTRMERARVGAFAKLATRLRCFTSFASDTLQPKYTVFLSKPSLVKDTSLLIYLSVILQILAGREFHVLVVIIVE
jgi:hypothetical protein